jgi:hypothetical protein
VSRTHRVLCSDNDHPDIDFEHEQFGRLGTHRRRVVGCDPYPIDGHFPVFVERVLVV